MTETTTTTLEHDKVDLVKSYFDRGFQLVFWPGADPVTGRTNDWKGPREKDWIDRVYTLNDYTPGDRVGIMHGVELSPGKYVVDVDIDYGPGVDIALKLLPGTQFIWGRTSKRISHCLYTCPDVIPMYAYKDVGTNGITLIEFRADRHQSMAPPSVWEKDGKREPLTLVANLEPTFIESASLLKQRVCLAAIGMLVAKHLGHNGFGHEARLAWAGFLLRAGVSVDDLVAMGEAISRACNNREMGDVRVVVESTNANLTRDGRKVKGGPALATLIGAEGKAVIARINEWLGRDSDYVRDAKGFIIPKNQENIRRAIESLGHELSYDQFADKLLINKQPLEDSKAIPLWFEIERECRFSSPIDYFMMVIKDLAWRNGFHPVKDYLDGLQWDGAPRLDTWLITSGGVHDTPYTRAVSSIMLVAAVRRVRTPGCKYDEMVIWESPGQGTDKSSAAQALCPDTAWFSDDLPLNLKAQQLIEATLGKWIVEASDLAGKRKTEIEQLKAMLSRQRDGPARMAYAHFPVERPRHFIFIGTTNSSAYLTDPTGSRRFWPVAITQRFDVGWIRAHRDQLWAEACVREARGDSIRLPESLWPVAAKHQESRREVDPWETTIRTMLTAEEPMGDARRRVTSSQVWEALGIPLERRDRFAALRITDIMQRLGFKRTRVRVGGDVQMGFVEARIGLLELEEEDEEGVTREPGEEG